MSKPTSKVIQISSYANFKLAALCEDGSIWIHNKEGFGEWSCILKSLKEEEK